MCMTYYVITKSIAFILCSFFYTSYAAQSNLTDTGTVLVHVLFRHGERTPDEFYPTDPHQGNDFFPVGLGGLTNRGKLTEFNLGNILRDEYGNLLGEYYTPSKIVTRSTEKLRARMSALLVLAGIWPPKNDQKWHPSLSWQPIPIHFKPYAEEDLLDSARCRYYAVIRNGYSSNRTLQKIVEPYIRTFSYVTNNSGMIINDLVDLQRFYFILATEDEIGLKLPEWTNQVYPEPIYSAVSQLYGYLNSDLTAKQINAGYLVKKMLNDFNSRIAGTNENTLMYLYSAHDTTLGYFLDALTTLHPHVPRYGSAVIFELHKYQQNYFVKLRYLETPTLPHIQDLKLPNCPILCPINDFMKLNSELLPSIPYRQMCDHD